MTAAGAVLAREAGSLVARLRLWTPARWAAAGRAGVAHHLAQSLADAAARLEGAPPRPLPRLDGDLALPDQIAVTADDVVRAGPPADVAVACTAHLLLHRLDLLGDAVPQGLAAALGLDDVVAAGRRVCEEGRARPL